MLEDKRIFEDQSKNVMKNQILLLMKLIKKEVKEERDSICWRIKRIF